MGNKKSSMTPRSWGLNRMCGAKYPSGPDIENWEDKRQNQILAKLEEKERLKNQRKGKPGKKWKGKNRKNRRRF